MICLGYSAQRKAETIASSAAALGATKIVIISPTKYRFKFDSDVPFEWIDWPEVIMYRTYYRLLQEIDRKTLVVVNECLRTQNRHDLSYNCIRLYLQQAGASLVLQWLPLIDTAEDFGVLFDFATRSQWKREPWPRLPLKEAEIRVAEVPIAFRRLDVQTDDKTRAAYEKEKRKLIDGIELKDPHAIPRTLHLLGGKIKLQQLVPGRSYVGRNDRFKAGIIPHKEDAYPAAPYTVFEWPHSFIDFADTIALSGQSDFDVLTSDLKVDGWYLDRYTKWTERLRDAYSVLRQ